MASGRHQRLLTDPDVRRWHESLARRAKSTADNYLRMLGLFLERVHHTPKSFLKLKARARRPCSSSSRR